MADYTIQIVSDPAEAQKLWDLLTPRKTIYDEWDFRWFFFKFHPECKLHFVTAFSGETPVALLPLQKNPTELLEFMGGDFMEDNRVFVKPGHAEAIQPLFGKLGPPVLLRSLIDDSHPFLKSIPADYPKYTYDLKGIGTLDVFIDHFFQSKSKANLKKKIKSVESLNLVIHKNRIDDFSLLADYNIKTFGDESSFIRDRAQIDIFKELCQHFPFFIHSFEVAGKKQAVSFSLLYKKTYLYLLSGTNKDEVPNLGNFLILNNIKEAIENGCETFDAGRHDCNWKERWHLTPVPEHRFGLGVSASE